MDVDHDEKALTPSCLICYRALTNGSCPDCERTDITPTAAPTDTAADVTMLDDDGQAFAAPVAWRNQTIIGMFGASAPRTSTS